MNVDRHYAVCHSILPWSLAAASLTVGCPAARIDYSFEESQILFVPLFY